MPRKSATTVASPVWTNPTYTGNNWTVSQAIQTYGGDKSAFVAAYANESGKSEATARRAVNRWLIGEHEKNTGVKSGKQGRQLGKQGQAEINRLANKQAGGPANIKLSGKILVNRYPRTRTINLSVSWDDIYTLEDLAKEEGEDAAWDHFADLYEVKSVSMESGTISVS